MVSAVAPKDGGLGLLLVDIVFGVIDVTAVVLRVWGKTISGRSFKTHDYCIFVALVS